MTGFGIILGSRSQQRSPGAYHSLSSNTAVRPAPRRIPHEFYPTPPEATRALLSVERFDGDIWEPACGHSAIATELIAAGYRTASTDIVDHGYGVSGIDFLKAERPLARHIVTNPPYGSGLADAFITKALFFAQETHGTVAMLINLASLAHRTRTAWWRRHPPARLYAIDDIVCWPEHIYGPAPSYFTRHRYCWAVWTPDHKGPPAFWWLSAAEFRRPQSRSTQNERKPS